MKAIGLMAGTSLDGIDAALVDIQRPRGKTRVKLLAFETLPYSGETVRLVLEASDPRSGSVDKVARLNVYLGELFGEAALAVMKKAGARASEIKFIGSHGQTIQHLPEPETIGGHKIRATLQVGDPSVIAARTGAAVVGDFRMADIAAGGGGAPLVPYVDWLLFADDKKTRFLVNIGGISNATLLVKGGGPSDIRASDIGPGNMVIDELVRRATKHGMSYDRDGAMAARGKVDKKMLESLLGLEFLREKPPKSTGRELFGSHFTDVLVARRRNASKSDYIDLIATATEFTARAIRQHYERFHHKKHPADEVIVSGGGARNLVIMERLAELFAPARVASSGEYGVPALAKEAIAFAVLAGETMKGRPAGVPGATGAKRAAVLGKIAPAPFGKG